MLDEPQFQINEATAEQKAIVNSLALNKSNLLIRALAGTGKTTTLKMLDQSTKEPILYLAFNRRNVDEAEKERKAVAKGKDGTAFSDTTVIRTFNGVGHRIWMRTVSKVSIEAKKTQNFLRHEIGLMKGADRSDANSAYWDIIHGVAMAKSLGYVPDGKFPQAKRLITQEEFHASLEEKPSHFVADIIDSILIKSIKASYEGLIDYNDQIYMPALFGGSFPRFPNVFVDEYQDLNPTNIAMLRKLGKNRVVAVGDDFQSIYAFRGAVRGALQTFKEDFSAVELPLTVCFRCPRAVVEACHWLVPEFKWVNHGGTVGTLTYLLPSGIPDNAAIICRNNAPLLRMAFNLLAAGRSVAVAGKDIGPKLIGIFKKLGDGSLSRDSVMLRIDGWLEDKLQTSNAPEAAKDMAECMKVFAGFGTTLDQACSYVEHLFAQQGAIKLLTGHKAKGMEWKTVYHLDPWLLQPERDQDANLRYVITTRAKQNLFEIDSGRIRW